MTVIGERDDWSLAVVAAALLASNRTVPMMAIDGKKSRRTLRLPSSLSLTPAAIDSSHNRNCHDVEDNIAFG